MKKYFLLLFISIFSSFHLLSVSPPLPTSLRITVMDELGNFVEGAKVQIFVNEDDYRNEENAVQETLYSDAKGRVTFKHLDSKVYFLLVVKGDKNNNGAAVQTDTLEEGRINRVNVIIE